MRNCLFRGMRDRKRNALGAELRCDFGGGLAKDNRRATTRLVSHLDVLPRNSAPQPGAQRFHGCLFGGETRGKALGAVAFRIAIADFVFSEDAREKALAEAADGLFYTADF